MLKAAAEWGGRHILDEAISSGQAWMNGDGTVSWNESCDDNIQGKKRSTSLLQSKKLSNDEAVAIQAVFGKLGWNSHSENMDKSQITIFAGDKLPAAVVASVSKVPS